MCSVISLINGFITVSAFSYRAKCYVLSRIDATIPGDRYWVWTWGYSLFWTWFSILGVSVLEISYLRISYLISFVLGISSALIIPSFPANFSSIYFHSTPSSSLSEIFAKNDLSLCYALKIPPLSSKHLEGSGTKVIIDLSNVAVICFSSKK